MLKLLDADGKVKREFPGAVSVQYVGSLVRIWGATSSPASPVKTPAMLAEIKLEPGETLRE